MTLDLPAMSSSTSFANAGNVVGRTEPRLWTPPLRELTPDTSYGFDVIEFATDVLEHPLDPWQQWAVIHAGELLPDGAPRFRIVLILVARQNGKTELVVVLTLYWLWIERVELVLGTSTKLEYAAESWKKACRLARRIPELRRDIPRRGGIRKTNGEQTLWRADEAEEALDDGSRYKIAAANEDAGRSLSVNRLVLDELRQHHTYDAWDAAVPTTSAWGSQTVALSNAGSDRSIVLNELREQALAFIETGEGDPRIGLLEWSSPKDASPLDVDALAQANPNLVIRKDVDGLLGDARTALAQGGDKLAGFKTEHMCIRVVRMDPAINLERWGDPAPGGCLDPGTLAGVRTRVALCVDVAIDGLHATLAAAAVLDDGRVRVEPVAAWDGPTCTQQLRAELPDHVERIKPQVLAWFPNGPAAVVAADMADRDGWPPRGVTVHEIKSETTAVCMGFAEQVQTIQIAQSDDPLLNAQIEGAEKLWTGDVWRFVRRGAGHCDGVYAAAGAVHEARTLPAELGPFTIR